MKTLEAEFTKTGVLCKLLKRNSKAAVYRKETPDGVVISHDVFHIMRNKAGDEIYPNGTSSLWSWDIKSEEAATRYFNSITAGDVVVPEIDPETGFVLDQAEDEDEIECSMHGDNVEFTPDITQNNPEQPENDMTDELSDGIDLASGSDTTSVMDVKTGLVAEPVLVGSVPDYLLVPDDQPSDEAATPDIVQMVAIKKPRKPRASTLTSVFPAGEFTQTEFADLNSLFRPGTPYYRLQIALSMGQIGVVRVDSFGTRGRPKTIYTKL